MARRSSDGEAGGIEFLTPDPHAFTGTTSSAAPLGGPGRERSTDEPLPASRRAGIAATLGLLVVIAAGTALIAPWGGDGTATTTTTPATTVRVTLPVAPPSSSDTAPAYSGSAGIDDPVAPDAFADETPGFLITPPSDLQLGGAFTADASPQYDGWGEVWATPGATRTSGRWVAVTIAPFGWNSVVLVDAVRVAVDRRIGVLSTAHDGVSTLTVAADFERADRLLRLEAWGFTPDELAALAGSIGLESDRPQLVDDRPVYRSPERLDGLSLLLARATDWDPVRTALVGSATQFTFYLDPTSERQVWLARLDPALADSSFALAFTPAPLSTDAVLSRAGALPDDLVIGTTGTGSFARWTDPATGELLLAIGTLAPAELQALVPSARQASPDEWASARRTQPASADQTLPTISVSAGRGTLADGTEWQVVIDPVNPRADVVVGATSRQLTVFDALDDHLAKLARPDLGIVVARRPGPNTLRISTAEGVIEQLFSDATAVAVDTLGPYTVDLLGANGQIVDSE